MAHKVISQINARLNFIYWKNKYLTRNLRRLLRKTLTLYVSTPQNGQTHSSNLSAIADVLFQCV